VSAAALPIVKADILTFMIQALGEQGRELKHFQERLVAGSTAPRGIDEVRAFLNTTSLFRSRIWSLPSMDDVGRLLDWSALADYEMPEWSEIREQIVGWKISDDDTTQQVANFAQGLHRYDQDGYHEWRSFFGLELIDYLKLSLNCLDILVTDDVVEVSFIVDDRDVTNPNDQAVSRLNLLGSVFPFAKIYQSSGRWILPFGLIPTVDATIKHIQRDNLHFASDL
jgi:hypothetical protein